MKREGVITLSWIENLKRIGGFNNSPYEEQEKVFCFVQKKTKEMLSQTKKVYPSIEIDEDYMLQLAMDKIFVEVLPKMHEKEFNAKKHPQTYITRALHFLFGSKAKSDKCREKEIEEELERFYEIKSSYNGIEEFEELSEIKESHKKFVEKFNSKEYYAYLSMVGQITQQDAATFSGMSQATISKTTKALRERYIKMFPEISKSYSDRIPVRKNSDGSNEILTEADLLSMDAATYKWICVEDDTEYIGETINFKNREYNHEEMMKNGLHHCKKLRAKVMQHGKDAFAPVKLEMTKKEKLKFVGKTKKEFKEYLRNKQDNLIRKTAKEKGVEKILNSHAEKVVAR